MGRVVGIFFNAGRKTIDQVVRNVLPFMAFVTMLIGLILYTGIGDMLAKPMGPLANNIFGLLVISAICGLPFLSPILGPGAVIAQVIGVAIIGPQIANGTIAPGDVAARVVRLRHAGRLRLRARRAGARRGDAADDRDRRARGAVQSADHGAGLRLIAWAASFFL